MLDWIEGGDFGTNWDHSWIRAKCVLLEHVKHYRLKEIIL